MDRGLSPRVPSGLFPSGPSRPTIREPYPVRVAAVLTGAGATVAWLIVVGLFAQTIRGYVWLTFLAAVLAWACAIVLIRLGDRGVATGVAIVAGLGVAIAVCVVVVRWATTGWPLW